MSFDMFRAPSAGVAVLGLVGALMIVSPAAAQSECTCVLPAGSPLGSITFASPDVFVAGGSGPEPVTANTVVQSSTVITTGAVATATVNMGSSCNFSMAGSMRMQIVPQADGQQCVQVIDESVTTGPQIDGGQIALAGAAVLGVGVVVSLGMLNGNSVSAD